MERTVQERIRAAMVEAGIAESRDNRLGDLTDNAHTVLNRRYLAKDRSGTVLEDPDGMFRRVAVNLSQSDLLYGATESERQATEDEFYQVMRRLEFLPNSPTMMNAGRELQQLSACFVLPIEDSLDSIFTRVKNTAMIHKSGGGTGFGFSRLRPRGDVVGSTGGVASGPVSFINAFDSATDVVKQGGTRRGANMAILDVTHPDILAFIEAKRDGVALQNFNISVGVTEDFMERVRNSQEYDLVNPRTEEVVGQLSARDVFDLIVELAWETGDPGLVFLDRINRDNPNPQLGDIESTNPCGEQPLLPFESCNLGSLNLARMVWYESVGPFIDYGRIKTVIVTAVHMLDSVIDMNEYPLEEIAHMSRATRRIGLGIMGWADLLVQLGIRYDSDAATTLAETLMRFIQTQTYEASGALAAKRGTFPEWARSVYNTVKEPPIQMRNSAPVTIAPTGTISIIAGASSGIEPMFALSYERNVMDNTRLVEGNPYFEAIARHEGFYSDELMTQLAHSGSIADLDVPDWVKDTFRVSHEIAPHWHVKMQAAFQKYTDNAVSKTINFPEHATIVDVFDAYWAAYMTGCKGITVYRDGSKDNQVLQAGLNRDESESVTRVRTGRPRRMYGITERVFTGHGNMYVTVNMGEDGRPFELFGAVGKAGGCDAALMEALSRLASLALRSDIDANDVINQLKGITCCPTWDDGTLVRSGPDAVAVVLNHIVNPDSSNLTGVSSESLAVPVGFANRCPECANALVYEGGCATCYSCGYNKCE